MFDSGANLFSELKSIFENGAASNGGSHPKTQKWPGRVRYAPGVPPTPIDVFFDVDSNALVCF